MKWKAVLALISIVFLCSCGKSDVPGSSQQTAVEESISDQEVDRALIDFTDKNFISAKEIFEKAAKLRSKDPFILNNYGVVLAYTKDFEGALKVLSSAKLLASGIETPDYVYISVVSAKKIIAKSLYTFPRPGANLNLLPTPTQGDILITDGQGISRKISWLTRDITDEAQRKKKYQLEEHIDSNIESVRKLLAIAGDGK